MKFKPGDRVIVDKRWDNKMNGPGTVIKNFNERLGVKLDNFDGYVDTEASLDYHYVKVEYIKPLTKLGRILE